MFEQLKMMEERCEALAQELSNPELLSDTNRYRAIAKEHATLGKTVEVYRKYKTCSKELEDHRRILAEEKDADLKKMVAEEIPHLEKQCQEFTAELEVLLLPKDPNDEKNILLEIRAGTGGEEAALFAADLVRMYQRFAERQKWNVEILSQSIAGRGGLKEIIALISGNEVYRWLKFESGVHRVQRVPETEASGRIHTSAVTVAVLPEAEEIDVAIDPKDLRIDTFRAGGAGGQHVNKTDSAVRITHLPTGVVAACQDDRSQHKNRSRAMTILRSRLLDMEMQRQQAERTATRRAQVGSGDRSEKIRTYNFPQNRMTDHRIGFTSHNLLAVMEGDVEDVMRALQDFDRAENLKGKSSHAL